MALAPEQVGIGIRRHFTEPGVHPYDIECAERLNGGAGLEALLLGVLSGAPCESQPKALALLGEYYASCGELERAERALLLGILARSASASWNLAALTLPEELRDTGWDTHLRLETNPRVCAGAIWLATTWNPRHSVYLGIRRRLAPRLTMPSSEEEALRWVFGDRPRPAEFEIEPPDAPNPIWDAEPTPAATEAFEAFRPARMHLEAEPDRVPEAEALLRTVLHSPPSHLHRSAFHHLAVVRHLAGDDLAAANCLARAALLGDGSSATALAIELYPYELSLAKRHLTLESNEDLALAWLAISKRYVGQDGGPLEFVLAEVRARGRVVPPFPAAYRTVWEAYPDAR